MGQNDGSLHKLFQLNKEYCDMMRNSIGETAKGRKCDYDVLQIRRVRAARCKRHSSTESATPGNRCAIAGFVQLSPPSAATVCHDD